MILIVFPHFAHVTGRSSRTSYGAWKGAKKDSENFFAWLFATVFSPVLDMCKLATKVLGLRTSGLRT